MPSLRPAAAAVVAAGLAMTQSAQGFVTTITGPIATMPVFYAGMPGTTTMQQYSLSAYPNVSEPNCR